MTGRQFRVNGCRKDVRALGQDRVLRDHAELLLPGEDLFAHRVPAKVELALELVRPLLGDVVWGVRAAGRVENEPWLVWIPAAYVD